MTALLLHIGHAKTGTSWIQSSIRLSRKALAASGIGYVSGTDDHVDDPRRIAAGNGVGLLASPESFNARLAAAKNETSDTVLFSSEDLFNELDAHDDLAFLPRTARQNGFETVRILLFIRDPIGNAASLWQQRIKRDGGVWSAAEAFAAFDYPERTARLLNRLGACGEVEITIRNYSRCKDRLLDEAAGWLCVPAETLAVPPAARVNRSMTRAELALQTALNRRLGIRANVISNALCERLPDIVPDKILPSLAVQEQTWERLLPAIERVNARLPEAHRYRRDLRDPGETPDRLGFETDQIELIADLLGGEIATLQERMNDIRGDLARHFGARRLLSAALRRLTRKLGA